MKKPTESAKRTIRLPSRISRKALARMEAEAMNKEHSATYRRPASMKETNRALIASLQQGAPNITA